MSLELLIHEVKDLLATTVNDLKQARIRLRDGSLAERVEAAGEIRFLHRREVILRARLKAVLASRGGWLFELSQWTQEQGLLMQLGLEHWLAH